MDTLVFALLDAAASTSANRPESLAFSPKAVRASVTISEVVPRFSPEAAARFMIPARPSTMSPAFHPAIAMYWYASALSAVENLVFAAISIAFWPSKVISSPVAPEMACTLLIPAS